LLTEEYRAEGGRIVFAAPSETLLDAVALLNLGNFLDIQQTLEGALAVAAAK
jgi:hypothetical protein